MQKPLAHSNCLEIPSQQASTHACSSSAKMYRRVLANWASDLLIARENREEQSDSRTAYKRAA